MGQAKRNREADRTNPKPTATCDYDLSLAGFTAADVRRTNMTGIRPAIRLCGKPATRSYKNTMFANHGMPPMHFARSTSRRCSHRLSTYQTSRPFIATTSSLPTHQGRANRPFFFSLSR